MWCREIVPEVYLGPDCTSRDLKARPWSLDLILQAMESPQWLSIACRIKSKLHGLDPAGNGEPLRAEGRERCSHTTLGIWAQTSQVVALGVKLSLPVAVESVLERLEQQPQDSEVTMTLCLVGSVGRVSSGQASCECTASERRTRLLPAFFLSFPRPEFSSKAPVCRCAKCKGWHTLMPRSGA